jgi:hypothetical protein
MSHDQMILALEVGALAVMIGLLIWRLYSPSTHSPEAASPRNYDMRRDGQRLDA